jgi:cell division transport system permease protein
MRKRVIGRGVANLVRNSWLTIAACIVMSITLLTVFVSMAATLALNGTVDTTKKEKSDLSVFMKNDTPDSILGALEAELKSDSNVDSFKVMSSAEQSGSLEEMIDDETKSIINDMDMSTEEMLPVRVSIRVHDIDDVASVTEIVTDDLYAAYMDPNSYDYQFYNGDNTQIINTINSWAHYTQIGGLVLGGIFLMISVLVIFNTIRMAIFARKEEIEMEKLIGAEKSFVRGPFLVEAELYGIIAGIIATVLGYMILWWAVPILNEAEVSTGVLTTVAYDNALLVVISVLLVGLIIVELSARLAVRKYLKY